MAWLGAVWRWNFARNWAFEPGFGDIIHDGERDDPFPDGTPQATAFEARRQLLARVIFFAQPWR